MPRKKSKLDPAWQEKSDWQEKVKKVNVMKKAGYSEDLIANVIQVPTMEVTRIIEDEERTRALATENYKQKIPKMKDIIGYGIEMLTKSLHELVQDDAKRKELLATVGDLVKMKDLIKDMELLVRLSENKSTNNLAIAANARETIEAVKALDPVFSYPELPPPPDNPEDAN